MPMDKIWDCQAQLKAEVETPDDSDNHCQILQFQKLTNKSYNASLEVM
jgi:hypothetical protein